MLLAIAFVGCEKVETPPKDCCLAGVKVAVGENNGGFSKLFVLNEGNFKKNNASLDFLRFSDGNYFTSAFKQINPDVIQGLGDTGNDIVLNNGKLWIAMNVTGAVNVVDAENERYVSTVAVKTPRNIVFDGGYAYVSSYAGAVYGSPTPVNGKVYKIDASSFTIAGSVEVGCQPEGLAAVNGKLYVANSGGFNPEKEKTVSVIDLKSFKAESDITLSEPNLKDMYADKNGKIWVSSYGLFGADYSMTAPTTLCKIDPVANKYEYIKDVHVSAMTLAGDYLYCIGNAEELTKNTRNCIYKVNVANNNVETIEFKGTALENVKNPYGICVNPVNGDLYITDAGGFTDAGKLYCFDKLLKLKWSVVAGVAPKKAVLY